MYASERARYAVCTENGGELAPLEGLFEGGPANSSGE
jgi:hypothetical protein